MSRSARGAALGSPMISAANWRKRNEARANHRQLQFDPIPATVARTHELGEIARSPVAAIMWCGETMHVLADGWHYSGGGRSSSSRTFGCLVALVATAEATGRSPEAHDSR